LFLALGGVYLLGIAGVVVAGSIVESPPPKDPVGLEERLAAVREAARPTGTIIARRRRRRRHRADAAGSFHRAVESITRAFTPVVTRRMSSDVATSGSLRSARSH
jgi:hypothetical protein